MIFRILSTARNVFLDLSSKLSPDTFLPIASEVTPHTSNHGICVTRKFSADTLDITKLLALFDNMPADPSGVKNKIPRSAVMINRVIIKKNVKLIAMRQVFSGSRLIYDSSIQ